MISIVAYTPDKRKVWNEFVALSKNGTFMIGRDYLEYHADRFIDASLLLYDGSKLVAVLPASRHGNEVRSHGGLTYGGLIYSTDMTAPVMLECFSELKTYLSSIGVERLLYKRVPAIYYSHPSDEDLYALFVHGARLIRRDISSCIQQENRIRFKERRRRGIKKALKNNLQICVSQEYEAYIALLTDVLEERHQVKPVHTGTELRYLADLHPKNIKLYAALSDSEMVAGVVVYETENVAHTQYLANSQVGRTMGALDVIIDHLVKVEYCHKKYVDFGISTEGGGLVLNEGLVTYKQEFGAFGIVHDFYELRVSS